MDIRMNDRVVSTDSTYIGRARQLFQRDPAETDPLLQLYGSYLLVESLEYGDDYFIPTDFIAGHDADGQLVLKVSMRQVMEATWTREPGFVAHGRATSLALAS